jgi:hypothetical protein
MATISWIRWRDGSSGCAGLTHPKKSSGKQESWMSGNKEVVGRYDEVWMRLVSGRMMVVGMDVLQPDQPSTTSPMPHPAFKDLSSSLRDEAVSC